MSEPDFFPRGDALTLAAIAAIAGVDVPAGADPDTRFDEATSLEGAGPTSVAYMDNPKYADALDTTAAGLVLTSKRFAARVPAEAVTLVCRDPYRAFATVLARLVPSALRPQSVFGSSGVSHGALVHPTARIEHGATIDPGATIGPHAEIGAGTIVASGAVVGPHCRIGRNTSISPGVTILNALIGNRVIIHPGVRIGQDGFGFAMGAGGHQKVPQVGRVVVQDDVEIGANCTIDRGSGRDTVIGEGTKIDNLVQIGHNVVVGRHCVIVSQVGISGSATLEDFVVLGGQVGVIGHVTVGAGAQIAATSNVNSNVPAGARWGGTPAKPVREWFREITAVKTLAMKRVSAKDDGARAPDAAEDPASSGGE